MVHYDYPHPAGTDTWIKPFFRGSGFLKWISKPFVRLDIDLGELPEPCVIAANHRSMLDFIVGLTACHDHPRATRVMVAERYFRSGLIARFLLRIGSFATPSKNARLALDQGVTELQRGNSVIIMPEGKLSRPEDRIDGVGKLHRGVSILAYESGAPVVPVAVLGTDEVWPYGKRPILRPWRRPHVLIAAAPVLHFTTDDHEANVAELHDALALELHALEKRREEHGWSSS